MNIQGQVHLNLTQYGIFLSVPKTGDGIFIDVAAEMMLVFYMLYVVLCSYSVCYILYCGCVVHTIYCVVSLSRNLKIIQLRTIILYFILIVNLFFIDYKIPDSLINQGFSALLPFSCTIPKSQKQFVFNFVLRCIFNVYSFFTLLIPTILLGINL